MAVAVPSGLMLVDQNMFFALVGLSIFSTFITLMLVVFLKSKMPEAISLMKAEMFKRPWVHVHTSLGQLDFDAPKRSGDEQDENCYEMKRAYGIKLVPDPEAVEHTENGRRVIHYYSKAAPPITAKQAAACRDVVEHLKKRGVSLTEPLIDALFIASEEELNSWYGDTPEMLKLVNELKAELQVKFIHDGQFVWTTVKEFIFAASNETSRSLDEFKSIAHEQADERVRASTNGADMKQNLMLFTVVIFVIAIGYKIAFAS